MIEEPEREFKGGEPGMVAAEWDQEQARILDIIRDAGQFILTCTDVEVAPEAVGVRIAYAFRALPADEQEAMRGTAAVFELVIRALQDELDSLKARLTSDG